MTGGPRADGRGRADLRPLRFERDYTEFAPGSVLVVMGRTRVLCTASVETRVPRWMHGTGKGWVTAEYSLLPGSTAERVDREAARGRQSGRTHEIQRLIGRSLRAVTDLRRMGEVQVTLDCDVLQADGGTRTAAICGAWVALHDALARRRLADPNLADALLTGCAAVSVGVVDGVALLDLDYSEDVRAEVDMNVAMTSTGQFVEIQGTAEAAPLSPEHLNELLELAAAGAGRVLEAQAAAVATPPPPR